MPEFIPQHVPSSADALLSGYLAAAEWLLDDETDRDAITGWSDQSVADATADCEAFAETYTTQLAAYYEITGRDAEHAGHDLWLSRNGHGAGFFDRGTEPVFRELQKAARGFGTSDAYLGDDGHLYLT